MSSCKLCLLIDLYASMTSYNGHTPGTNRLRFAFHGGQRLLSPRYLARAFFGLERPLLFLVV